MEHRWGERVTVDVPVKLMARPFAARNGQLLNVSVSGALIRAEFDLRRLTRLQVAVTLPRLRHPAPIVPAYVTRTLEQAVGVEWCEFAPRAILDLIRAAPGRALCSERLAAPMAATLSIEPAARGLLLG